MRRESINDKYSLEEFPDTGRLKAIAGPAMVVLTAMTEHSINLWEPELALFETVSTEKERLGLPFAVLSSFPLPCSVLERVVVRGNPTLPTGPWLLPCP